MPIFDERLRSIGEVLTWVAGALGLGLGARRLLSKDARDRAKNNAEQDYFSTHASELILDRDNWRRTAEEAWAKLSAREEVLRRRDVRIAILRLRLRTCNSQLKLQRKLMVLYPGIGPELDSGPMPLDNDSDIDEEEDESDEPGAAA